MQHREGGQVKRAVENAPDLAGGGVGGSGQTGACAGRAGAAMRIVGRWRGHRWGFPTAPSSQVFSAWTR